MRFDLQVQGKCPSCFTVASFRLTDELADDSKPQEVKTSLNVMKSNAEVKIAKGFECGACAEKRRALEESKKK